MTRKKRVCECKEWGPPTHEPCGDPDCGECTECDDCGGKGYYFITSDAETPATRQITVIFANNDEDIAGAMADIDDLRHSYDDLGCVINAPIDEPLTATIGRVAQDNTGAFGDSWLLRWVALVGGKEIGRGDVDGSPYANYTVRTEWCDVDPLPLVLRVAFGDSPDPKGAVMVDGIKELYTSVAEAVGFAADDYTERVSWDRANPGWLTCGSAWVAWDEAGAEVGRGRITAEIAWEFDVSVDAPQGQTQQGDRQMKSTDVLNEIITADSTYCLDVRNEPEPDDDCFDGYGDIQLSRYAGQTVRCAIEEEIDGRYVFGSEYTYCRSTFRLYRGETEILRGAIESHPGDWTHEFECGSSEEWANAKKGRAKLPDADSDRHLSPAEVLIRVMDMIRINSWEIPCDAVFRQHHNASTGAHDSDHVHFHWRSGHEMHVHRAVGATDGDMCVWRRNKDGRVYRAWPTTTVTSVGDALMFLLGSGRWRNDSGI